MSRWYPTFSTDRDGDNPEDLREAVKDFCIYVTPLVEMAKARRGFLESTPPNEFVHGRRLCDHTDRIVTAPNDDTVYSVAFLDLRDGAVDVNIPDTGERYVSLAFLDMYSNNIAYMGTSQSGGRAATLRFIGPSSSEVERQGVVRSPTPWVWVIGRILVDGEGDLRHGWTVQDGLEIRAEGRAGTAALPPNPGDEPSRWLDAAWSLIDENHPPEQDKELIATFRCMGLDSESIREVPAKRKAVADGLDEVFEFLATPKLPRGGARGQWIFPKPYLGDFGQHYTYRAIIAMAGLGALKPDEAIYLRYVEGEEESPLDGRHIWRLCFPADALPPVDSFWSLSLYEPTGDGRLFFTENRLNRYSIGDRTPGLIWNADGSLDIWMCAEDPGGDRRPNWLPAPAGPFTLILRAYLPARTLLAGHYHPPVPERL